MKIIPLMDPKDAPDFDFDVRKVDFNANGAMLLYGI